MGYSFNKDMHVGCSDVAADFLYTLGMKVVTELKVHEKIKQNCYNTDGILNVAMILADCFSNEEWEINPVADYCKEFIPRFEKWIEKQEKDDWDNDEDNKAKHLAAFNKILANLKKIVKYS